jgi:hypothetical protein
MLGHNLKAALAVALLTSSAAAINLNIKDEREFCVASRL